MAKSFPPVLITSAVRVSAGQTKLTDESERLSEIANGLRQWIETPGVKQIVICDGSGYDLAGVAKELSRGTGVEIEAIAFVNDANMVREKGKGWGEGEIVKYALSTSEVLSHSLVFAKCTGKLWVSNYLDCLGGFNGTASFDFSGLFSPRFIDTRFYVVGREFYARYLIDAYRTVCDANGFYLEHAFLRSIERSGVSGYAMSPTPRIRGMSGSMARQYEQSAIKGLLRDARSRLIRVVGL